jgi:hypothetical protein
MRAGEMHRHARRHRAPEACFDTACSLGSRQSHIPPWRGAYFLPLDYIFSLNHLFSPVFPTFPLAAQTNRYLNISIFSIAHLLLHPHLST